MIINAPIVQALLDYNEKQFHSFHVPGHKKGQILDHSLPLSIQKIFKRIMKIDATEIIGLDNLHDCKGIIRQAQQLAAKFFGANETYFLVNGSTTGNLALILGVCKPQELIIVQRNVHKSVIHALQLAQAKVIFIESEIESDTQLPILPSLSTLKAALNKYPQTKAVFLSTPNYHGRGADLSPYVALVHSYNIPILVDEAHGAHFGLHPSLFKSALQSGADGVVQSTHKMLTAMTMGAMLHLQGPYLNKEEIKRYLQMLQTSSPSYPIMASLDLTRALLERSGTDIFNPSLKLLEWIREKINQQTRFKVLNLVYQDPFKLVIYDESNELTGFDIQKILEKNRCIPEMSDFKYTVLCFSIASTEVDFLRLFETLRNIHVRKEKRVEFMVQLKKEKISEMVSFKRTYIDQDIQCLPIFEAIGQYSSETIFAYPPGVPILYCGEKITESKINELLHLKENMAEIQGVKDQTLQTLLCMKRS